MNERVAYSVDYRSTQGYVVTKVTREVVYVTDDPERAAAYVAAAKASSD